MQNIQLDAILHFSPYIGFTLICLVLYLTKKMTFNITIILFALTTIARMITEFIADDWVGMWSVLLQAVICIAIFIFLVFFMGNVSWETLLTLTSMLAFTPIPDGITAFLGTYVLILIYSLVKLDFKEVYRLLYDAVVSSGVGQALPNYEHLPDKELKKGQKRITLLPFILIAYSLTALYYILSPYWMES